MIFRRILASIALLALAACGTASDAVTFQAPPGYTQAASIGPFVQVWHTSEKLDMITLMALPVQIELNKAMSQAEIRDGNVTMKRNIQICDHQPALFADIVGDSKTSVTASDGSTPQRVHIEFVATNVNNKTYMAMYMRPLKAAANPAAEAAIQNICPKSAN